MRGRAHPYVNFIWYAITRIRIGRSCRNFADIFEHQLFRNLLTLIKIGDDFCSFLDFLMIFAKISREWVIQYLPKIAYIFVDDQFRTLVNSLKIG